MTKSWDRNYNSLRRWKLMRFKSIEAADLPLAPLTLVVGANSVGKSSLLQSILLMAQASDRQSDGNFALNGTLVQLGEFDQVKSDFADSETVEIAAEFMFGDPQDASKAALAGNSEPMDSNDDDSTQETTLNVLLSLRPSDKPSTAVLDHASVGIYQGDRAVAELVATSTVQPEVEAELDRGRPSLSRTMPHASGFFVKEELLDASILPPAGRRFRRSGFISLQDKQTDSAQRIINAVVFSAGVPIGGSSLKPASEVAILRAIEVTDRNLAPERRAKATALSRHYTAAGDMSEDEGVQFLVQHLERAVLRQLDEKEGKTPTSLSKLLPQPFKLRAQIIGLARRPDFDAVILPRLIEHFAKDGGDALQLAPSDPSLLLPWTSEWLTYLETSIHYLGPLREDPKVFYAHGVSGSAHLPIGRKGEHTAATLLGERMAFRQGSYPGPDGSRLESLQDSVRAWVRSFRLAEDIQWGDEGRAGVGLTVGGRDLTSVGTGVSQILPVLVICLQARPGELVLLEQPELHLNPGLQQLLGDFFLEMAKSGRQLIVETHSEYLVTRLRRRVVEDDFKQVQRLFTLLFASQDEGGKTSFEVVDTKPDGSFDFETWPKGFFDHAGDDVATMIRAAARRRAADSD